MRPWHLALVAVFFVPSFVFLALKERQPAIPPVVLVTDSNGASGSAVPISRWQDFTIFLTARHVVDSGEPFTVLDKQVTRVELHETQDLALIWVQVDGVPLVPMSPDPSVPGDRIEATGWSMGAHLVSYPGIVSVPGTCSAPILPGCSGGAVMRDGKLIGVISKGTLLHGMKIGNFCLFEDLAPVRDMLRR